MVFALRQRAAKVSLSFPKIVVMAITFSLFVLFEPTHGQPNYYFKASAPAVKSLPRIGRRSGDDAGVNDGPLTFPRSMDVPGGIFVWQSPAASGTNGGGGGGGGGSQLDGFMGSRSAPSLNSPLTSSSSLNNNQMNKALLWRKLFGEAGGNNYDDIIFDSFYTSKS